MLTEYTGYFDASGGKDHGFIVVAGWLSTVERWKSFEIDWNNFLVKNKVSHFHMSEFAHSKGPFANWKGEPRRAEFLGAAVHIISSHVEFGVACIVDFLYRPRFPGHKVDVHAATGSAAWSQAARVRAGLR